jgi:hypothetical protein
VTRGEAVAVAIAAAAVGYETYGLRTGNPDWLWSTHGRRLGLCSTRAGRVLTPAVIGAAATWLAHHLITIPAPKEI